MARSGPPRRTVRGRGAALAPYRKKRKFDRTPEPEGVVARPSSGRGTRGGGIFVIQKHDASRLHYDVRLEMDGVLKSWAVPKGPSLDPGEKRLAVAVEDHPVAYARFEGVIPEGEYGAGPVIVWDRGRWEPEGDPHEGLEAGRLSFTLEGEKLHGGWALVRMGRDGKPWLLIKRNDAEARRGKDAEITADRPESVISGREVGEVASRRRPEKAAGPGPGKAPGVAMPATVAPELATLVKEAPEGSEWIHEQKLDGYRLIAVLDDGRARLWSRGGLDWTARYPTIARAVEELPAREAVLDGELVAAKGRGPASFEALQAPEGAAKRTLRYEVFDLLHLDGKEWKGEPLLARKEALARLLRRAKGPVRLLPHVVGGGPRAYAKACRLGWEGIVSKKADAPYRSRRTPEWRKVRCGARQEMVIGGYVRHARDPQGIGALVLGVHDENGGLRYAGRVGTGFTVKSRRDLFRRLESLSRSTSPFADEAEGRRGEVQWVRPALVAEVAFTEWTRDGRLRHPSFLGLREDKPASDVVRERPETPGGASAFPPRRGSATRAAPPRRPAGGRTPGGTAEVLGVSLRHTDRVLWPEAGVTKRGLAEYVSHVAKWMLPLVKDRPLMLLRCPEGWEKGCFVQKHLTGESPPGIAGVRVEGASGPTTLAVRDERGLVSLVGLGAAEVHVWGSRADLPDRPDRVVFDLDPAPDVPFGRVVDAAREIRERLENEGLRSFAMTTGGKGLHVHVPLARVHDWETVRTYARSLAAALAAERPDVYVATASKAKRHGRIYVDALRNGRGATAVAPYSPRARRGAPVATPLAWAEVGPRLDPMDFTVTTVSARLRGIDPWRAYAGLAQRLPAPARNARS